MPITGALIIAAFGLALAILGAIGPFGGVLPIPLFVVGAVIAVVSLAIARREFLTYRAQRRHIESKKNAKLDTTGLPHHSPKIDSRLEAFLDSQPPTRKR